MRIRSLIIGLGMIGFLIIVTVFGPLFANRGTDNVLTNPTDLRAFYCAGETTANGHDPYLVQPLATCEQRVLHEQNLKGDARHLLPAPLPPFAISILGLLAQMPFINASCLWFGIIIISTILPVIMLQKITKLPLIWIVLSLLFADTFASILEGQIVPIVVLCIISAVYFIKRGYPYRAAFAACFALIEPHLGIPAFLALALFVPSTRIGLAAGSFILLILSFISGFTLPFEYISQVIPLHARSEVLLNDEQYSLSSWLYAFGFSKDKAILLGSISYGLMLTLGLALGRYAWRRTAEISFIILVPTTAILIGGPFLHIHQMAAAIPLGLLLISRTRSKTITRSLAIIALILLAIPFETIAQSSPIADNFQRPKIIHAVTLPHVKPQDIAEIPYTIYMENIGLQGQLWDKNTRLEIKAPTLIALILEIILTITILFLDTRKSVRQEKENKKDPKKDKIIEPSY